jgi:diguanylate cyclase (GGDEF)-like protein
MKSDSPIPASPQPTLDGVGAALLADLVALLRECDSEDAVLAACMTLLHGRLGASAGLTWALDPARQWRLVDVVGDKREVEASLATEPEPRVGSGRATVGPDAAQLAICSSRGEPVAVLRLLAPRVLPDLAQPEALLLAAAGVAGHVLDRLHADQHFQLVQRTARIGAWHWDAVADEVSFSTQMYANFGVEKQAFDHSVAGFLARVHPEDRDEVAAQVQAVMEVGGPLHMMHRILTDAGASRWIECHARVELDQDGNPSRLYGTSQDITGRRVLEQQLTDRIERDELTGLANRISFLRQLQQAAGRADGSDIVVVALLDVDRFQKVNDHLGWAAGDHLLQELAARLRRLVPEATTVARLGSDEFAVLLHADEEGGDLDGLGERLGGVLEDPPPNSTEGLPVHVSIGIAHDAGGESSPDQLMRAAGVALETSRSRHDVSWQIFDPSKHGEALQRLAMEADLRHAVDHGDIEVAYQPVLSAATGDIVGVEALARWHRPGYGPVSPGVFIPLAERVGLIGRLGRQVLEEACRQLASWRREHPRAAGWKVAVNLAAAQLDDVALVELVGDTLERAGLDYDRLILEVTESALAHDTPGALARLFELRRRGVRLAIDDFGTGYSSLSRLRELPFDILKIDRSFIQSVTNRLEPTPILQALFTMTRGLDLDVVGEGVETPVQLGALATHGCDFLQGYLFSHPLPPGELTGLLGNEVPWDLGELLAGLPAPTDSPELQRLLDELVADTGVTADHALDEILVLLAQLTGLDSVYLTRIHLRRDVQEILAVVNTGPIRLEAGLEVPWSETLCRRAIADERNVIVDAPATYPDTDVASRLGIDTYVGVEILGPKGGLRGTLCGVAHRRTDVSPETVETLQWVARLLADQVLQRPAGSEVP